MVAFAILAGCSQEKANAVSSVQLTGETREFTIIAKQWDFTPGEIKVSKGDKVRLTLKTVDVTHGFALPEFGIFERMDPGNVVTVEFVADKEGEFSFFCNVPCGQGHSAMGGKIVVG